MLIYYREHYLLTPNKCKYLSVVLVCIVVEKEMLIDPLDYFFQQYFIEFPFYSFQYIYIYIYIFLWFRQT